HGAVGRMNDAHEFAFLPLGATRDTGAWWVGLCGQRLTALGGGARRTQEPASALTLVLRLRRAGAAAPAPTSSGSGAASSSAGGTSAAYGSSPAAVSLAASAGWAVDALRVLRAGLAATSTGAS